MRGSINYLKEVKNMCENSKGNCDNCPLANKEGAEFSFCPVRVRPILWSDEQIVSMVRAVNG